MRKALVGLASATRRGYVRAWTESPPGRWHHPEPMAPLRWLVAHPVVGIAALVVAVLVAGSGGYGYHRDELYFLAAGNHLSVGYPDQGPFTPLVAGTMDTLAPDSLTVLRLPSALATGALVLLTGLLASEQIGR